MHNIVFLFLFTPILAFMPIYKNINKSFLLYNKNNNNNLNKIKIFDIDFNEIIQKLDKQALEDNKNLPKAPETEEEIIDDSFEGYLKSEFYKIADINIKNNNNNVIINFETFYQWRVNIGTVLYDYELEDIFYTINNHYDCDLMKFILINKIIDENDGADF